ncbi:hypothetical protein Tco_0838169 [Tanacetum coccineum]|uniref:Uncharacterized protein n=1 Tax=Tanacetum coccineum TaxID=301880 RepID=A0ABQ5APL3_9ASTR
MVVETKVASKDVNLSVDEVTLAQALAALKSAKPKADKVMLQEPEHGTITTTTAATTVTAASTRPKAKGLDKGKGKMVEPEPVKKLLKKDQLILDEELAFKLQAEEEERIWLVRQREKKPNSRKKHFAAIREKKRGNTPPTKAQKRNTMSTYLKNMAGYKQNQLKNKSFDDIQKLFDKAMKRVNTFVDMDTELVEGSEVRAEGSDTRTEGSSKRAGEDLQQESIKKQKVDEDNEIAELQRLIEVVPDKEEVAIDAIPLATKPPSILVKAKYGSTRPVEDLDLVLYGDLKTMFDPHVKDQVWKNQSDYRVLDWKLYDSCGLLIEKRFGGNAATKKTQRNLLKQQYENFTASSSEVLDQTFHRLQIKWNTHTIVLRNKPEIDTLCLDYLYNNLKIYEPEVKGTSSLSTNTQNIAFVSLNNTRSINGAINSAHSAATASIQATAVNSTTIDNLSDAVICAFFAKEMDLRWQMAMLTMRARRFLKNTRRKLTVNGLESVEARLLVYKKNEYVYEEDIKIVDECKTGLGYNAVPPPYTGNFMPPKPNLSFSSLEEFVNEPIVSEPTVKKPVVETSEAKTSKAKPKVVRKNNGAPIIED